MKYLWVKMRRDFQQMWVQFFSVFMMAILAITIYSGMEGVWYGLKYEVNQYYSATNLADIWVNGTNISENMINEIKKIDGVNSVKASMTITVNIETDEDDRPDLKLLAMESLELFNPQVVEGEAIDLYAVDDIWLDNSVAKERDIAVGDSITLMYGENKKTFYVKGLILDSEFIYYTGSVTDTVPNHTIHGYGLIGTEAAREFYGSYIYNELRLDITDDCDTIKLQIEVEHILGDAYYSFSERDDISSVSQITKEISQMKNMANLFSAVFILLALLSMYTTMTRLIKTQMVQIGTMKALGISNFKIRLHYVMYGFCVSVIGCLLGTLFGQTIVSRAVMKVKKTTLTLPGWQIKLSYRTYLIIILILLICMIATLFATRRGLNRLPAETMRISAAGSGHKKVFDTDRLKILKNIEYNWKWMIRDIMQNKVRWLMSIIGVAGSMVLMMAGFGFKDSINYSNEYVYEKQYTYSYKMVFNTSRSEKDIDDVINKISGKYQLIYENNVELYYNNFDDKEIRTISVIEGEEFVHLEDLEGNKIEINDKVVAISKKIAKKLNVTEGCTIKCRIIGEKEFVYFTVTDIVISPSPQGIFVSEHYWGTTLDKEFIATSILLEDETDYLAIRGERIIKEVATIQNQISSMEVMTKSVMTIIYLMIVASVLLGTIILYNLGMLNYIERFREYATMKVLGFYQKEVRNIIIRDCVITTIIGWLLGVPIGYQFLKVYIGVVQFNSFEWVPTLSTSSFILSSIAVIMCSILVNLFVAYKVTKISMVEALKSVE